MICFDRDDDALYLSYETISGGFPGWSLTELRDMTYRLRCYWLSVIEWRMSRG